MHTVAPRPAFIPLLLTGIAVGLLSGLFGVGGGILIMPTLTLLLGLPQRLSAGTSVAAVLPAATVGATSYAIQGNIEWVAAGGLAIGIIVGAQVGAYLLPRVSSRALQWCFMVFLLVVIVLLWVVVPSRDDSITINAFTVSMLIVTGVIVGIMSGLLGVGGGVIVVPVLMFFFGSNDLSAKGASLFMMIPGSISGTLGNLRRNNVDLRVAAIIGLTASLCVPFSSLLASAVTPLTGNILFSGYLTFLLIQMLFRQLKRKKKE